MLYKLRSTYREFPPKFWVLVGAAFIDTVGSTLLHPYLALYVTRRFGVGMTQAGILFAIVSVCGLLGSIVGGALTDRWGRRKMVLFGLVSSATITLSLGLADRLSVLYGLAVLIGLFTSIGGPAAQAMVADLLPEEQRAEGFGIVRVGANLAWIIGPTIGGLLASTNFLFLFVADSVISLITAVVFYRLMPETKPKPDEATPVGTLAQTLLGYRVVIRDAAFVAFIVISIVMLLPYQQLYSTLSVFLRDVHGISAQGYGFLLSLNAGMVVLLQFAVTHRTKGQAPALLMALAATLYAAGFGMLGFVASYAWFVVSDVLITIGEMISVPVSQALAAQFAPEDMRGRYLAFFGLAWTIPSAIGPWAGGIILDNYNPNWLWYACALLCGLGAVGFGVLHRWAGPRLAPRSRQPTPAAEEAAA
jgi:MFS family permease